MLINYLLIAIIGFSVGIVFISLLIRLSLKSKILVAKEIPLVGGLGIYISFLIACLAGLSIYKNSAPQITGIIIASFIMLIFGLIDDWRELSITAKFLVQIIAAYLLVLFGIRTKIVYIGDFFNIIITFIWVIGITNAFNHLDILDGLAGGTAIIVNSAFLAISILNNDINTAVLSLALIGAIFSFLIYNLPPAKTYMGNAGSHFLGFVLAAVALAISYAPLERKIALLSPLLILGLPIFDTAFVIFIRLLKKNLPFNKSNDHLALRFLVLGRSKKEVLLIMLGLSIFFSFSGILVSQMPNIFSILVIAFVILLSLAVTKKMSKVVVND